MNFAICDHHKMIATCDHFVMMVFSIRCNTIRFFFIIASFFLLALRGEVYQKRFVSNFSFSFFRTELKFGTLNLMTMQRHDIVEMVWLCYIMVAVVITKLYMINVKCWARFIYFYRNYVVSRARSMKVYGQCEWERLRIMQLKGD